MSHKNYAIAQTSGRVFSVDFFIEKSSKSKTYKCYRNPVIVALEMKEPMER